MNYVELQNIVSIKKGKKVSHLVPSQTENAFRYIQIDDLRNDNNLKYTEAEGVHVKKEDVVIAWDGANAGTIGYGLSGIIGSTLAKLELADADILPDYLGRFLQSKYQVLRDKCTGATIPHISRAVLLGLKLPVVSKAEQSTVIAELDRADALRQKRKQAIELLDDYVKAVFLDMFGDPVVNPKGWEMKKLGEMLEFITSGSRGWAKYYSNSGRVFLRIQNVGNNILKTTDLAYVQPPDTAEAKRTKVLAGDVLMSITADLGRTAVVPEEFAGSHISQHLALLRFKDEFDPEYISEYLASVGGHTQIESRNKGGTKAGLNFADVKSISVPIPGKEIQLEYKAEKKRVLNIKSSMQNQAEKLDSHFRALMQKAFAR